MSAKRELKTGERFNNFTVESFSHVGAGKRRRRYWLCKCICGKTKPIEQSHLVTGHTKSCGCLSYYEDPDTTTSKEYQAWAGIKERCYNQKSKSYQYYGGRGIRMCEKWLGSFEEFLKDVGPCPGPEYSVGRLDNDGDYEPGNAKWQTVEEQANNRSDNNFLTYDGETKTLMQWSRIKQIPRRTLQRRLAAGWSVDDALHKPLEPVAHMLTYNGKTQCKTAWAKELGMNRLVMAEKLTRGFTLDDLFEIKKYQAQTTSSQSAIQNDTSPPGSEYPVTM